MKVAGNTLVHEVDESEAAVLPRLPVIGDVDPGDWSKGAEQLLRGHTRQTNASAPRPLTETNRQGFPPPSGPKRRGARTEAP
jgi:hypothetical protein